MSLTYLVFKIANLDEKKWMILDPINREVKPLPMVIISLGVARDK